MELDIAMAYALAAYLMWGLFPAFFPLLEPASPLEIIGHRIIWTAVFMSIVLTVSSKFRGNSHWRELRTATPKTWLWLCLAGALVAINWLIYVIAVNSEHVADAALGYFINPLVSVALGMLFLSERLYRLQLAAIGLATLAVVVLTILGGQPPLLALGLAFSFGFYGLVKKRVGLSAIASLTAETLILLPAAVGYIAYLEFSDQSAFAQRGLLLMSAGVVTALPLLAFGAAAKRIDLSTIGMLQYMTPTMQMLWAVFVVSEHIPPARWAAFGIIWLAVALYIFDLLRRRTAH